MRRGSKKNRAVDYWLGIPLSNVIGTISRIGRRPNQPATVAKVGVMCSPALGDTLLVSGAFEDLRSWCDRQGAGVEIVHFCMKQNIAAAELIPAVDRRVRIDLTRPWAAIRLMRAEKLDLLLDFTSWQRVTALLSMMAKAGFTIGFRTAGQHRGRGYDLAVEHRNDRHEVDNFRAILRAIDIDAGSEPTLAIAAVHTQPLAGERDIVVFHLWASGAQSWLREWPGDRWIELAKELTGPATIFAITGAPGDLERSEPFVRSLQATGLKAVTFTGGDGFVSLSHLLLRSRVVVSVNTGVMHLAAVLGVPTVSINGPTRNLRWGPVGRYVTGVQPQCDGCEYLNLGFEFDGHRTDCMEQVTVQMVANAAREVQARRTGDEVHNPVEHLERTIL